MQPTDNRKTFIYCRTATTDDDEKRQEKSCRDYADQAGYAVVASFYDKGVSGMTTSRLGIDRMLSTIKQHKSESPVVLIESPCRLGRDIQVFFQMKEAIKNTGAELVIVSDYDQQKRAV